MTSPNEKIRSALPHVVGPRNGARAGRSRGTLVTLAALALVLGFVVMRVTNGKAERVQYTTEPVRRDNLTVTVTATGTLEPTNQVDISSELSGIVRSVEVDFNDVVRVGQVLAQLDTSRLDAEVLQSKAALESAEARVREAEASENEAKAQLARLERVRDLSGGKVPSVQELTAQQAAVARTRATTASARASVSQARATLEAQQTDLYKTAIRSPVNGIVLSREVEPGQTVASSLQAPVLFTLAEDLAQMELHVSVDEADVGEVRAEQAATFTVDAWPDRTFPARVEEIHYGAETVAGVVTYETVLSVDNSEGLLRPGMTATAEIVVRRLADALLVPNAALRFAPPAPEPEQPRGGLLRALMPGSAFRGMQQQTRPNARQQRVWILRDGEPVEVQVETGPSDGTFTQVTSDTIEPGTELVVSATESAS